MPDSSYSIHGFSQGEGSPDLLGRQDSEVYSNSVVMMRNMIASPVGPAVKRPGFKLVNTLPAGDLLRLLTYRISEDTQYGLLVRKNNLITVFNEDDEVVSTIIHQLNRPDDFWRECKVAQTLDSMYIAHQDHPPIELKRVDENNWEINQINMVNPPFYRFDKEVRISTSNITSRIEDLRFGGTIALVADSRYFTRFMVEDEVKFWLNIGPNGIIVVIKEIINPERVDGLDVSNECRAEILSNIPFTLEDREFQEEQEEDQPLPGSFDVNITQVSTAEEQRTKTINFLPSIINRIPGENTSTNVSTYLSSVVYGFTGGLGTLARKDTGDLNLGSYTYDTTLKVTKEVFEDKVAPDFTLQNTGDLKGGVRYGSDVWLVDKTGRLQHFNYDETAGTLSRTTGKDFTVTAPLTGVIKQGNTIFASTNGSIRKITYNPTTKTLSGGSTVVFAPIVTQGYFQFNDKSWILYSNGLLRYYTYNSTSDTVTHTSSGNLQLPSSGKSYRGVFAQSGNNVWLIERSGTSGSFTYKAVCLEFNNDTLLKDPSKDFTISSSNTDDDRYPGGFSIPEDNRYWIFDEKDNKALGYVNGVDGSAPVRAPANVSLGIQTIDQRTSGTANTYEDLISFSDNLWILEDESKTLLGYTHSSGSLTRRPTTSDITLADSSKTYKGLVKIGEYLWVIASDGTLEAYTHSSGTLTRTSANDHNLGVGTWTSGFSSGNTVWFMNDNSNLLTSFTHTSGKLKAEVSGDFNMGPGVWRGISRVGNTIFAVDDTSNTARGLKLSDTTITSDPENDINIGAGDWTGLEFIGDRVWFLDKEANYLRSYDRPNEPRKYYMDLHFGGAAIVDFNTRPEEKTKVTISSVNTDNNVVSTEITGFGSTGGDPFRIEQGSDNITSETGTGKTTFVDNIKNILAGRHLSIRLKYDTELAPATVTKTVIRETRIVDELYQHLEASYEWAQEAFGYQQLGYPRSFVWHQDRLFICGTKALPSTVFGSGVGNWLDFQPSSGDRGELYGFDKTINSDQVEFIQYGQSKDALILYCSSGVYTLSAGSNVAISPSRGVINRPSPIGVHNIRPIEYKHHLMFLANDRESLYIMNYSRNSQNYLTDNMSVMSPQNVNDPTSVVMLEDFSKAAYSMVLITNSNGTISVLQINDTLGTRGWSTWDTQGGQFLEGIVVGDTYYCAVRRGNQTFIEKLSNEEVYMDHYTDLQKTGDKWSLDATGARSELLTSEELHLVTGAKQYLGTQRIEGNMITPTADKVFAGLHPVSSTLKTLPLAFQFNGRLALGNIHRMEYTDLFFKDMTPFSVQISATNTRGQERISNAYNPVVKPVENPSGSLQSYRVRKVMRGVSYHLLINSDLPYPFELVKLKANGSVRHQ